MTDLSDVYRVLYDQTFTTERTRLVRRPDGAELLKEEQEAAREVRGGRSITKNHPARASIRPKFAPNEGTRRSTEPPNDVNYSW